MFFAQSKATGQFLGRARLVDCFELSTFEAHAHRHCVAAWPSLTYKKAFAWVLQQAERFEKPFAYGLRTGAVVWMKKECGGSLTVGSDRVLKRKHGETLSTALTSSDYEEFHKRSCIRSDFSSMYYTLGLAEEVSEVLEACRSQSSDDEVVKECGDVLWYATGLLRNNALSLTDLVGSSFLEVTDISGNGPPELDLVMVAGTLAGRVKKFERGDYDAAQLKVFLSELLTKVCRALHVVCASRNCRLVDAATVNKEKIEKRIDANMIKGDGSNREELLVPRSNHRSP